MLLSQASVNPFCIQLAALIALASRISFVPYYRRLLPNAHRLGPTTVRFVAAPLITMVTSFACKQDLIHPEILCPRRYTCASFSQITAVTMSCTTSNECFVQQVSQPCKQQLSYPRTVTDQKFQSVPLTRISLSSPVMASVSYCIKCTCRPALDLWNFV